MYNIVRCSSSIQRRDSAHNTPYTPDYHYRPNLLLKLPAHFLHRSLKKKETLRLATVTTPRMQIELCFHVVCRRIHSSSAKSRAELRCSGSHCSIFRMKRRKDALSSSSLSSVARRVVSRSSSDLESGRGIPTENSPCGRVKLVGGKDDKHLTSADLIFFFLYSSPWSEKNLSLNLARARRLGGGGPRRAIISAR